MDLSAPASSFSSVEMFFCFQYARVNPFGALPAASSVIKINVVICRFNRFSFSFSLSFSFVDKRQLDQLEDCHQLSAYQRRLGGG